MEGKNVSRFSTLRVFKLAGAPKPPPPPPKDAPGPYNITPYMTSGASTSQLTLNTFPASSPDLTLASSTSLTMRSPTSDDGRFLHPHSPLTPPSARSPSPARSPPPTSAFKKGFTKLTSFGKRPSRSQTAGSIPNSPSMSALHEHPSDDEGISGPWNFQHHVHVNGDLRGMPPSWTASLLEAGFSEHEIAALGTRRRPAMPSSDDPPEFSSTPDPPQFTSSAPASSSGVVMLVNPKPRNDSLRRPVLERSASSSAATTLTTSTRRPPSPASSSSSSHPATSTHTNAGSLAYSQSHTTSTPRSPHSPQSPATDSPTHSNSLSHSSGRSPPPAPLSLRPFRVVNEDPTPAPASPPPAYASPTPTSTLARARSTEKAQRRRSIEKPPLPEPDVGEGSSEVMEQGDVQVEVREVEEVEEEDAPLWEEEEKEMGADEAEDEDRTEIVNPPSPLSRAPALPPRLSLHTDQDDGWGDMFSFLPSSSRGSVVGSSKRISLSDPARSSPSKRESVQSKRRSKRFVTALAITPTLYTHSDTDTQSPAASSSRSPPAARPAISDFALLNSPDVSKSHPDLLHEPEPSSSTTVYPPERSAADIGILTPDPAYPIADSPLWEEVRTLVREGPGRTPPVDGRTRPILELEEHREEDSEVFSPRDPNPASEIEVGRPPSEGLLSPPLELRSRFSHDSDVQGPSSRFSDATSFQGHSRFSEAPSLADTSPPHAELASRFSAWSTASHPHAGYASANFARLEAMPESPGVSPASARQQIPVSYPPPRRSSDLPPPLPPPKDELPPPPPPELLDADVDDEDNDRTADESRVSHLSNLSNISSAQIHGARIATRVQVNVVPLRPTISPPPTSTSSSSTKSTAVSTPVTSPQNQRPPPLPLPPLGKVLPSLIASQRYQERRKQHASEEAGSQDSHGQSEAGHASPATGSSSSHSRSSSNSAESGMAFGSSFGHGDRDPQSLSASASSYEEPPKSPMLAYLEDEPQRSPKPVIRCPNGTTNKAPHVQSDEDDEDTVPLARLRAKSGSHPHPCVDEGSSPEDDAGGILEDWLEEGELSPEQIELEASLVESPGIYDHRGLPNTPFITVNGFVPPAKDEPSPDSDVAFEEDDAEEEEARELPLALTPLREYIALDFDPREMFLDLQEVAQGQYGSVYAARLVSIDSGSPNSLVAVKKVPIPEHGTPKIDQLRHELGLMSQVRHKHILGAEGLFFDFAEDALWIRMELMERSLADVLVLSEEGLQLGERLIARFASDALLALAYLSDLGIAHRDVRSDNLLITSDGVLKLADFSNAVRVSRQEPLRFEVVGVHHWQAPEMRRGGYDASKVDVWSLGATAYEMAECAPPFADIEDTRALSDRWPPLSRADAYSGVFHDFLRLCSEPPISRPQASQLLHNPFIQQACPRDDILQTLHLCRELEESFQQQGSADSQGTVSI